MSERTGQPPDEPDASRDPSGNRGKETGERAGPEPEHDAIPEPVPDDRGASSRAFSRPGGSGGGGSRRGGRGTSGGGFRRIAKLWGFLGFCILVLVLARETILPFVFALLLAYILAPLVRRLSERPAGGTRMPRGVAILTCYLIILAGIALFLVALLPRITQDVQRIAREAPALYAQINDVWAPKVADWVEEKFPDMGDEEAPDPEPAQPPVVAGVPLPPNTQFVVTPLPDGRMAVEMEGDGVDVVPRSGGGFTISSGVEAEEESGAEEQLRDWAKKGLIGLQDQLGDVVRFGQAIVFGVIQSVFTFFLVLMIAAFILLDIGKVHGFARSLVPVRYRDDYDVIVAGVDRGLSGVIRGQLMICLVNAVLTYIGLVIFQVKYSLILAVVAGVLSLIPIFGSILSTIPIVLAALVSGTEGLDIARGVFMIAWIVGIHFLEANLLNPKIIGSAAKIHPVFVIFALIVGEHSYGLTGALLAVPVASIVQVLFVYFQSKAWRHETTGPHRLGGV